MASIHATRLCAAVQTWTVLCCLVGVLLCSSVPAGAQTNTAGTIRVESSEVFVPVLVVDKQRLKELQHMNPSAFQHDIDDGDFQSLERLAVPGLSLKDFTVLQDGEAQRIVSIGPEGQRQSPIVTDNLGKHREYVGVGGGIWTVPLWESYSSPGKPVDESPSFSGYVIGFIPPPSPDGSCHKLQVLVNRPNSLVLSRNGYCRMVGQAANPLRGTRLGERIESDLRKDMRNQLSLEATAIPLFANDGTARVRIVLNYAPRVNPVIASCDYTPNSVGIVGTFSGQNKQAVLRFSDETVRRDDNSLATELWSKLGDWQGGGCYLYAPIRYETQIEIPPGQYHLEIGFMDGRKFGRAEVLLTVPSTRSDQLSISGIVLARRFRDLKVQPPELPIAVPSTLFRDTPTIAAKSATALPGKYPPLVTKSIEVTPTANVGFKRKAQFYFYVQVYEPRISEMPRPSVNLKLRIVSGKTKKIVRDLHPVNAAPYASPGKPIIPIGGGILLANLPKGSYELQAKATDSSGASTAWRTADFTIEK